MKTFTHKRRNNMLSFGLITIISLFFAANASAQHYRHRQPNHHHHSHYNPHFRGYRFHTVPRGYVSIPYNGFHYRYGDGVFVRPHGPSFVVIAPPIGIRVNILPPVYTRVYVGRQPYFYANGTFYNQLNNNQYQVIQPPVGAKISALPADTRVTVINGQKYYVYDDVYYREIISSDNEIWYEVVGNNELQQQNPLVQTGARFPALPQDAKMVVVAGQKYYVSQGVYYAEVIEGDRIMYEIVGKE